MANAYSEGNVPWVLCLVKTLYIYCMILPKSAYHVQNDLECSGALQERLIAQGIQF